LERLFSSLVIIIGIWLHRRKMSYIIIRLLLERIYHKMSFHVVKRLFESFWFKWWKFMLKLIF
jgi:hypothetical protein